MTELIRKEASSELDPKPEIVTFISLAGEDFSEFLARLPGAFYFLGAGNQAKETHSSHRHPRFSIDEDVLNVGVVMQVNVALDFFKNSETLKFLRKEVR